MKSKKCVNHSLFKQIFFLPIAKEPETDND